MPTNPDRKSASRALPASVWALGIVSMLMDISSEMIHSLMPVFLVSVLGLGPLSVGVVSGIAEATAAITRVFSGALSDYFRRRKPLALLGYAVATAAKPLFPLATSLAWVVAARFVDRIGKGIRAAPRDALITDVTEESQRGAAFGLRKALDSAGAAIGPALAIGLMAATGDDIRTVYWLALIPALAALVVLFIFVKEPERPPDDEKAQRVSFHPRLVREFKPAFLWLLGVVAALHFAMFSESFMLLRAAESGLAAGLVPLVLVVMNIVYMLVAYFSGRLSDRRHMSGRSRSDLLYFGIAPLIGANLVLFASGALWPVLGAAVLWGAHLGVTRALLPAIVADVAPAALRGTAFGAYYFVTGITLLPASLIAGGVWAAIDAEATFLLGAGLTALALLAFTLWHRRWRRL